jgi:hypothetical protein
MFPPTFAARVKMDTAPRTFYRLLGLLFVISLAVRLAVWFLR